MAFSREDVVAYESATPESSASPAAQKPATNVELTASESAIPAESPAVEESQPSSDTDPAETGSEPSAEPTADSAPADAEPEGDTQTDEAKPAPKGTARERIEDLVAERNALRKYITYREELWKGNLPAGAQPPAASAPSTDRAPAVPPAAEDPRPTLEQFNYDLDAFNEADGKWVDREAERRAAARINAQREQENQTAAAREAQAVRQAFEERAEKFAETHPDFRAVILNPEIPALAPRALGAMVRSEQSAAILYHLAKNPDLAVRVARMSEDQQVMQIGRLEATVTAPAPKAPPKQKVSNAPPPPNATPRGSAPRKDPTDPSMTMDEFVALDRAERLRQRQQRSDMRTRLRGR